MRFELPIPPSVNALYRNVPGMGRVKTKRYKAWLGEAARAVMIQRLGQKTPEPPFKLDVWLYFPDNRRRDADNFVKAPQDCLSSVLGFNDQLVTDPAPHKRLDRENPRCVVYLRTSDLEEE